ncbi:MAG: hypothetical protein KKF46_01655 [Nanoarchaeota archaeon]|nr:hypothetical protein [Nanoarchaeota archaeon]MBU1321037.1 hypothetical protein [Nanoarchaeota archaeon]MBU1598451.1 hypothetical protein [Nanoarchaeota archaeon]MBU2441377.1 hypothetical protein [Nanoarchaeota archaeon]
MKPDYKSRDPNCKVREIQVTLPKDYRFGEDGRPSFREFEDNLRRELIEPPNLIPYNIPVSISIEVEDS